MMHYGISFVHLFLFDAPSVGKELIICTFPTWFKNYVFTGVISLLMWAKWSLSMESSGEITYIFP